MPITSMLIWHAMSLTSYSTAIASNSLSLATLAFFIQPFIMPVATAVMPGSIPMMLGTEMPGMGWGMAGLAIGDTCSLSALPFLRISRPKKVKKMAASMSMAAAAVARISGG